ncbi:Superkiller protein 3, partial [Tilletia horrida]
PTTSSLRALLLLLKDEQFAHEEEERKKERDVDHGEEGQDSLSLAIDGLEGSPNSLLAYRIAATLYLLDKDYASTAELGLAALNLLSSQYERDAAVELPQSRLGISTLLSTAYTHHFPPQNHARALRYADAVLNVHADDIDALLARAYIAQTAQRWTDAKKGFVKVRAAAEGQGSTGRDRAVRSLSLSQAPDLEARAEMAWCDVHLGQLESAAEQFRELIKEVEGERSAETLPEDKARTWWRLGRCLWDIGGESRTDTTQAFTCFITCLKRFPSFAPAYTSLGLYYDTVLDPPNTDRAAKCFQKAFELDARETIAARRLAEGFADDREWDLVEVVARRTVEGEGASEALQGSAAASRRHTTQNAWAWKAIGRVELGRAKYEKAIVAFQIAIRAEPEDANAWHQLGEAYASSGRHVAALKSFDKALELMPSEETKWQTRYSAALVHRDLGDFDRAIANFSDILETRPDEIAVRIALAETLLFRGRQECMSHLVARAEQSFGDAVRAAHAALQKEPHLRSAWKIVADATFELSRLGRLHLSEEDVDSLRELIRLASQDGIDAKLPFVTSVTLPLVQERLGSQEAGSKPEVVLYVSVYLYKARVLYNASEDDLAAGAWGDLAGALYHFTRRHDRTSSAPTSASSRGKGDEDQRAVVRQAIGCLRQAIKLQPRNEVFWLALGNLTFQHGAKVAQHCYIKAIELRPKSPIPWSNLGFLYLEHRDVQLANEAFIRAQTLEPEWAEAWVGQAFVAKAHQDEQSSRALFEHAVTLSEGSVLEADYGFGNAVYAHFGAPAGFGPALAHLYAPAFAMSAYVSHAPEDPSALHLAALFAERVGQAELAIERIERAAELLELEYEAHETARIASQYAIAEVNLGRLRLSSGGDGAKAIEAFETALALLDGLDDGDDDDDDAEEDHQESILPASRRARIRLQAQFGIGMAHYFEGQHDEAIAGFEGALKELEEGKLWKEMPEGDKAVAKAHVSTLLARVLWTLGGQEREEAAKAQLLDSIAVAPQNLGVIVSLAAAGAVTGDVDLMDAALSEIRELGQAQIRQIDSEGHVDFLVAMEHFISGRAEEGSELLRKSTRTKALRVTQAQVALAEALLRIASTRDGDSSASVGDSGGGGGGGTAVSLDAATAAAEQALELVLENSPFEGGEMLGGVARLLGVLHSIEREGGLGGGLPVRQGEEGEGELDDAQRAAAAEDGVVESNAMGEGVTA